MAPVDIAESLKAQLTRELNYHLKIRKESLMVTEIQSSFDPVALVV